MKFFERTGGHWLFWWTAVYFVVGILDVFAFKVDWFPWIQLVWLCVIALPLVCNPLARWLNMKENHMFDLFKKKDKESENVVKFPELKSLPKEEPPKKEEPAKIFYRLGLTDNNRVSFQMGYSEITMNAAGCQQMIDQLEFFKSQLYDEGPSGGPDGDGGEPVPVPEQKAA